MNRARILISASLLGIIGSASALALPVQDIRCTIQQSSEPVPRTLLPDFRIRRQWVAKAPVSEQVTADWSAADYEMIGTSQVIFTRTDETILVIDGSSPALRLVDGRNGFRDEIIDRSDGDPGIVIDGVYLESFTFAVRANDSDMLDTHVQVPATFEFPGLGTSTCNLVWQQEDDPSDFGEGSMSARMVAHTFEPGAFVITQGLNDAWFNPATNGQGFFIIVFEDIPLVFLAWFTYDTERPPEDVEAILGDPGHRWITAQGGFEGDTAELAVVITRGGVFDSGEPAPENEFDGSMTVTFESCTAGTVAYDIPSLGLMGEVPIQRIANDNVALCEELAAQAGPE